MSRQSGNCWIARDPSSSCLSNRTEGSRYRMRDWTHFFQHLLGVVEVVQHCLDIGLVGRPFQETSEGALRALHLARQARLGVTVVCREVLDVKKAAIQESRAGAFVVLAAPKLVGWLCLERREMGKGDGGSGGQAEGPAFHRSSPAAQRNTSTTAKRLAGRSGVLCQLATHARRAMAAGIPRDCVSCSAWAPWMRLR